MLATGLWALLGTAVVFLAVRARSAPWQFVGGTIVALAFVKSASFDWDVLDDGAAAASMLVVTGGILVSGFQVRFGNPSEPDPVEIVSLASGAAAAGFAIAALERIFGIDDRALGVTTLGVVLVLTACGAPAYVGWRSGREEPWLRRTANGYWALALGALLFAESTLVGRDEAGVLAVWAATVSRSSSWRPARIRRRGSGPSRS